MTDEPDAQQSLSEALAEGAARHNANRHLALYRKTGNGLLIWQAYREFRQQGLTVPEEILRKLDQYAARLLDGEVDLLTALDLKFNRKGGAGPRKDLQHKQRRRDIVESVHQLHHLSGKTLAEAYKLTARRFHTTSGRVEDLWHNWPKKSRRW